MKKLALAAALAAAAVSVPASAADLIGSTATASLRAFDVNTTYAGPVSATVGAGVEFPYPAFYPAAGTLDIGATTVNFITNQSGSSFGIGSFNGYRIDFGGTPIALTSVLLNPSSTQSVTNYFLQGNSLFIDVAGQPFNGGFALFDIGVAGVPEPSTWAMMLIGFGLVGFALRRRQRPGARVSFA